MLLKSSSYLCLLLLFFLCGYGAVYANESDYCFKQISTEHGLSQSTVRCILNDHSGVLWIGTKNGLNRYDQYELETYYCQGSELSLPDNNISFIAEDSLHNIWIGTAKGLVRYNRDTNDFIRIHVDGKPLVVNSFYHTSDALLFGGWGGLYGYDYSCRKIRRIPFLNDSPQTDFNHILGWSEGQLILASRYDGIYTYNLRTQEIRELQFDFKKDIAAIYTDALGNLWLSPYGEGLYCFDSTLKQTLHLTRKNSDINNDVILDIIERDGKILLATDGGGINIYDPATADIKIINEETGDSYSFPEKSILCLYNDADNNLWAGSIRGGLLRIKEVYIRSYKNVPLHTPYGLSDKVVVSLYEDDNHIMWIGTDGGGINSYDPVLKKFTHYPSTIPDKVVSIVGYSENTLLVSFFGKGIFFFDKRSGRLTPFTIVDEATNTNECTTGSSVYLDRCTDDKILLLGKQFYIYDLRSNRFVTVDNFDKAYQKLLQKITVGAPVMYLMNTFTIVRLDVNRAYMELLYDNRGSENIETAAFDGKNRIWIGSGRGLSYMDLDTRKIYKKETNLFQSVSTLTYDSQGRLWIGAQNMLFCYIPDEDRFIILGESDGVYPNELFHTNVYQSASNTLYLGGTAGLICINKEITFESDKVQTIQVADVLINGVSQFRNPDSFRSGISVPWNTTSIDIKLSTKEKDIFRKKIFRYNIAGLNDQYIESYNRTISLVSLRPGNYTVRVSCGLQSGEWSTPCDVFSISVVPPIWERRWFLGLSLLLLLLLFFLVATWIIRKNENRLKWQMREHEKGVDEEKIRFLINISHELRTPLTLIYAPLKRMLERPDIRDSGLETELSGIYKHAGQMKNIINMVLDLRRMETGQDILHLEPHPLHEWIRRVGDDFANEFKAKRIMLDYHFDHRVSMVSFDSPKCEIILSNLLMNALKYSDPESTVTISTGILSDKMVRISVADEGIGLTGVDTSKLFSRFYRANHDRKGTGIGLSYARILVEKHQGRIGAQEKEAGALFYFDLPHIDTVSEKVCEPKAYLNELLGSHGHETSVPTDFSLQAFKVLVVEDDPDLNRFLKEVLKENFRTVYSASNGHEALEITHACAPDIIVSDVMMPEMDGFEMCRSIKEDLAVSHIPVILLTARNDSESHLLGYKLGADAYLAKPFDADFLLTLIRNLLKNREQIRIRYKNNAFLPSPQDVTISNADEEFLLRLNMLIADNLDNPELDVRFMTEQLAMSRASLYNKVKALTDMGVNDYINKFRIEKSVELLTNTDLSITEISERTGFSYQRYFSSVFKQVKGVTPSGFRQNLRQPKEGES